MTTDREAAYLRHIEAEAARDWEVRRRELMDLLINPPCVLNADGSVNTAASRVLNQQRRALFDQLQPDPVLHQPQTEGSR